MAGSFITVACPDGENEQIVFEKHSNEVSCGVCGHTLVTPTGGISAVEGKVVDVVEVRTTDPLA